MEGVAVERDLGRKEEHAGAEHDADEHEDRPERISHQGDSCGHTDTGPCNEEQSPDVTPRWPHAVAYEATADGWFDDPLQIGLGRVLGNALHGSTVEAEIEARQAAGLA